MSPLARGAVAALFAISTAASASPLSEPRQVTFEGKRAGEGYFSADGTRMIFQSERAEGNPFYQIYLMDLGTGDVRRLSPGVGKTTCGWIHPSGERALFASTQADPEAEAKMQAELDFRASGQTRRYAWDYDPAFDITEIDLGTGEYTTLAPATGYDAEGAYSPDGSRIVFASNRHAYAEGAEVDAERLAREPSYYLDLYVMNADGTGLTRLTEAPGYDGGPFWSADGERIVWRRFSGDGATAEVYTMRADGTGERQITDLGVMSWAPFFHPSGEYIVFATNLQGFANFELYIVDDEGRREPVRVTERDGFDGLAAFHPSGDRITWTSNATADRQSQIFFADWDHGGALALLAEAPLRAAAPAVDMEATEAAITPADLSAHVGVLASEAMGGRLTGTEGEIAATAYVANVFSALGLDPAGEDGFFQPFPFTAGVSLADGNALTLRMGDAVSAPTLGEGWRPMGFSTTGETAEAGILAAGHGLVVPATGGDAASDDYDGLDVAGRWVLMRRGLPAGLTPDRRAYVTRFADLRYRTALAKARGAAGVIFAPPQDGEGSDLPRLAYEAGAQAAGIPAIAVGGDLADRLFAAAAGDGRGEIADARLSATVALDLERREGRNVLGRLDLDGRPAGEGLPPVVIGAHLDHLGRGETSGSLARGEERDRVHPGADDNASGVAAMIEVAQTLAAQAADGRLAGARDIVFAGWSGEELGLLGAAHYTDALAEAAGAEDLADLVSVYINMDMVGRLRDRLVVQGIGSSPVWEREIERRNAVVGLPIVTSEDPYVPTDAMQFYLARVPILSLFTGAHGEYHTPRDTADLLNYEGLADIARLVALVARSRAQAEDEPDYVERAAPQGQGSRRMGGVFLGTIPDYAEEGVSGVPISGVVKGGPAEVAGLEGGDVIVGLAGAELETIYDYVGTLNGLTPGTPVEITVIREGERRSFEIEPARRE